MSLTRPPRPRIAVARLDTVLRAPVEIAQRFLDGKNRRAGQGLAPVHQRRPLRARNLFGNVNDAGPQTGRAADQLDHADEARALCPRDVVTLTIDVGVTQQGHHQPRYVMNVHE